MRLRGTLIASGAVIAVATTALVGGQASADNRHGDGGRGGGRMVSATVPTTPSVPTYEGEKQGQTRVFRLTAVQFQQQIATFPIETATVWGWQVTGQDATRSTPGPTLVAYEGEKIQFVVTNALPDGAETSLHPHGTHQPNEADGLAGINFDPIAPGETREYPAYEPDHPGTFAYHTHTATATQEPRGLAGLITVLPRQVERSANPDVDLGMTLQQFNPDREEDGILDADDEGALVSPMPDERGTFPFNTINGRTGDASNLGPDSQDGVIKVGEGDLVQIRLYNASSRSHAMHMHGTDMTLVDINGHPVTAETVTTKAIAPGEFFTLQFRADNPGTWIFHCSFPGDQANAGESGYQGAPVGMTRIIQVGDEGSVPVEYFAPPAA